MKKKLFVLEADHKLVDQEFSKLLDQGVQHRLKSSDFFYITETKKKIRSERRVSADIACELLLKNTALKHFCYCTHVNVGFYFHSRGLLGPFSKLQLKTFLIRVLGKMGDSRLTKPYFVDQIFNHLKISKIAVNGAILLKEYSN